MRENDEINRANRADRYWSFLVSFESRRQRIRGDNKSPTRGPMANANGDLKLRKAAKGEMTDAMRITK